jgi:hypothetical protein
LGLPYLPRLQENPIQDRKKVYESKSDPLGAFIEEYWVKDLNGEVEASTFYAEYERYLGARGNRIVTYRVWRSEMEGRGFTFEKHRAFGRDNPIAFVTGIMRRLANVPVVPVVPDTSISIYNKKPVVNRLLVWNNWNGTLEKLENALTLYPNDNASILEDMFGVDTIAKMLSEGCIMELPAGTYRIV